MQPTQQNVVPVSLFYGSVAAEAAFVALDPAYDHVISRISVDSPFGTEPDYFELDDQDFNYIWGAWTDKSGVAYPSSQEGGAGIVLQSLTGIYITSLMGTQNASVSAYRLNPSAAFLFS